MPTPLGQITPQEALQRTIEHREIFHDEMLHLMRQIMAGEMSPVMMAALITGLRVKKETIGEISAAAEVKREFSTKVEKIYARASGVARTFRPRSPVTRMLRRPTATAGCHSRWMAARTVSREMAPGRSSPDRVRDIRLLTTPLSRST